ncbi:hypothetical protein PCANC_04575 [Puccinia coronata f. sp. avenae]|uniref:HhH-GPD domain-containing protein n=1 Tax=Puccinia coronata f. sp. avenae TaxID=200324 RepID=A0A2N5W0G8_9BASI|nr:hypothetical protein PCANC_21535 [Puccinia coronata f. sp. avenae]PLW52399.1 hypothetical protein PCASD_00029 [Puccinia coronata f. sp. avenae]PLW55715.1 hypothetical protein PCANC_04575 [Puccinia coronata f. sp. avenae]
MTSRNAGSSDLVVTTRSEAPGLAGNKTSDEPFGNRSSGRQGWKKPTISDCERVCALLAGVHGGMPVRPKRLPGATEEGEEEEESRLLLARECGEVGDVLDGLVRTILSQHTSRANSVRAKQALDQRFGTGNYHAIRLAPVSAITQVLQHARAGLAPSKSATIHALLTHIHQSIDPALSLEFLRSLPDAQAMETLLSFKGVGPKTASCVMLFCLGRNFFPVDTHVFRMTRALDWLAPSATRESAFKHLNQAVPDHLKYPLHMLLFQHARSCRACKRIIISKPDPHRALSTGKQKLDADRKQSQIRPDRKPSPVCPLAELL